MLKIRPKLIFLFWLVMMLLFIRREILPQQAQTLYSLVVPRDLLIRDSWQGIYFKDRRVGYTNTTIEPIKIKTSSGYKIHSQTFLALAVMGVNQAVWFDGTSILDRNLGLVDFIFNIKSGKYSTMVKGQKQREKLLKIDIISNNNKTTRYIILKNNKDILFAGVISPFDFLGKLSVGREYSVEVFDPFGMNFEKTQIKVKSFQPLYLNNQKFMAYHVVIFYKGLAINAWVDNDGNILKQESDLGWKIIKETAEEATKIDRDVLEGGMDIISLLSVPSNIILDSINLKYLKLKLTGLSDDFNIVDERQRKSGQENNVVEIYKEELNAVKTALFPVTDIKFQQYLKETPFIQISAQEIKNLARHIVGSEKDTFVAATKITQWLYKNIEKVPTVSLPSAIDVLHTRQGDCNEHTILFIALARSIGIPAEFCAGLVYRDGRFYYHAWPKVWAGQWVSVDPTFGQTIADPTHIKIIEGDFSEQSKLVKILGKLQIEVMDYK